MQQWQARTWEMYSNKMKQSCVETVECRLYKKEIQFKVKVECGPNNLSNGVIIKV